MEKNKYLTKNIVLFSIGAFFPKIISFFLVPLYTNILTTSEYGIIDLIMTIVSLLLPLLTINIAEGVMRFTLAEKENNKYFSLGVYITLFSGLIITVILFLLKNNALFLEIKDYSIGLALIFYLNAIYNLLQFYLKAIDKTLLMVASGIANSAVMVCSNIVTLVILKWGIHGYLIAICLGYLFADTMMVLGLLKIKIQILKIYECIDIIQDILKYSIPTVFSSIAWWINSSLDRFFIINMCGTDQNGIYSIAYKIPNILGIFQSIFVQAWTISAVVEYDKNDSDGFFGRTYEAYNSIMVIICSGIIILNIPLAQHLFAKDFFVAWNCVPFLMISSLFSALNGYMGSIFAAVKNTKVCAYSTGISAVVNALLNFILIPIYGIRGAAIATLSAYVVSWLIRIVIVPQYIHMKVHVEYEIFAYVMLSFQMVLALFGNKYILFQIGLFIAEIILLYRFFAFDIMDKVKNYIESKMK